MIPISRVGGKLTALQVDRLTKPGMHADGDGLYLQVTSAGARSWIYRFRRNGGERYMGLGPATAITLKRARELGAEARAVRAAGGDPLDKRRDQREAERVAEAREMTFAQCAERLIEAREASWRNDKHRQQWRNTLQTYVYPTIGWMPVADVDTGLVCKCLQPIWMEKPETARRVRGRIETILDWAKVAGYRDGENPARWRGHLAHLLGKNNGAINHHAALPYAELPAFMSDLRRRTSISARCLEVTILCALRTSESIGATRNEIDIDEQMWTIPAARMKGKREHRVPLASRAVEILRELIRQATDAGTDYVFPGVVPTKQPLSNMAMLKLLAVMNRADLTVHGFRSTFRDWAADLTNFQNHVVEMALAHEIGSDIEKAYRRGELIAKRRRLMDAWAAFAGQTPR